MRQLIIFIVLAGFLLNGNKSKYCVLPDPCARVPEVPGAGYARLHTNHLNLGPAFLGDGSTQMQQSDFSKILLLILYYFILLP